MVGTTSLCRFLTLMTASVKLQKKTGFNAPTDKRLNCTLEPFHSLVRDFFIVCIPVSELEELLETLHVPGCKETKLQLLRCSFTGLPTNSWERRQPRLPSYQLWTRRTDGVLSKLSGNKLISFMMLANRTGSSCRRKVKDVFSQAFSEPERQKLKKKRRKKKKKMSQKSLELVY